MKTHGNPELPRTDWTEGETRSLVELYRRMSEMDADGLIGRRAHQHTKKGLIATWIAENAPHRSRGSVEAKLMNISASCEELGLPVLRGFKPLRNRAVYMDEIVRAVLACVLVMVAA